MLQLAFFLIYLNVFYVFGQNLEEHHYIPLNFLEKRDSLPLHLINKSPPVKSKAVYYRHTNDIEEDKQIQKDQKKYNLEELEDNIKDRLDKLHKRLDWISMEDNALPIKKSVKNYNLEELEENTGERLEKLHKRIDWISLEDDNVAVT